MRRIRSAATVAVAASLVVTACGSGDSTPSSDEPTRELTAGFLLEPETLDYTSIISRPSRIVLSFNVMEGLLKTNDDGELEPSLAESYEQSDDGLEYVFKLREATFHDGAEFTAEDVVFSFERTRDPEAKHPRNRAGFSAVDKVEAVDDRTVRITMKEPDSLFLNHLGRDAGHIVDEASVDQLATHPIGTGPFKFEEWVRGDRISVVRNEDYWGDEPFLERFTFKYIPDASAMANAFRTQEIDIIGEVESIEQVEQFLDQGGVEVTSGASVGDMVLTLNNSVPPLNDLRVRRALNHAVNRDEIIDVATNGRGVPIGTHSTPLYPWHDDSLVNRYPHDPEKARELLAEAGFPDGVTLEMKTGGQPYVEATSEILFDQLAQAGITVKPRAMEFGVFIEDLFTRSNFQMGLLSFNATPDILTYADPERFWKYDSKVVQDLVAKATSATEESVRDEAFGKALKQITEDAVHVWLYLVPNLAVVRDNIEGTQVNGYHSGFDLSGITVES
jgi:peptide/nickel transport system substrate-binding protein